MMLKPQPNPIALSCLSSQRPEGILKSTHQDIVAGNEFPCYLCSAREGCAYEVPRNSGGRTKRKFRPVVVLEDFAIVAVINPKPTLDTENTSTSTNANT